MASYNKLVRDKVPEHIERDGGKSFTHIAGDFEFHNQLMKKVAEEWNEYRRDKDPKELADLLELIKTIALEVHKLSYADLEGMRNAKEKTHGGFTKRIILEEAQD